MSSELFIFKYNQDSFRLQAKQDSFFVKHTQFDKRKALQKQLNEELIPVAWHPNKWLDYSMSEDQKKEIEPIFLLSKAFNHNLMALKSL